MHDQVDLDIRATNSDHPYPRYPNLVAELAITEPDAVWGADIAYGRLQREFVSLAVLMDVYIRAIRGWELSRHLDQTLTRAALERAVATGHQPGIHHSDQGARYAATAYTARLEQPGAAWSSLEQPGAAWSNWEPRSAWPSRGSHARTATRNG